MSSSEEMTVDAEPSKDFFITMLVRDIELVRAIIDLVDNSLDGARRLRQGQSYEGLWVRIETTPGGFKINDNCGGIPIDIARHYAFRFGRRPDTVPTSYSVGQFGVGMKRAIFKMGKRFTIRSTTTSSYFEITEDVEEWKKKAEWTFKFSEVRDGLSNNMEATGTTIEVSALHDSVSTDFRLNNFVILLQEELSRAHTENIERGLKISLNGVPVDMKPLLLLRSEEVRPAYKSLSLDVGASQISAKIYAGIADSEPAEAGWYIFCNGRLVLGADQTPVTGWGAGNESTIPKYHNQYARFRGYVFFDSDDASLLPWNTTKTGVDTDSAQFRAAKQEMLTLMRPVIDFLNAVKNETDKEPEGERPLA